MTAGAHICSFSDPTDYVIDVEGREYRFEWSDMFGPCDEQYAWHGLREWFCGYTCIGSILFILSVDPRAELTAPQS